MKSENSLQRDQRVRYAAAVLLDRPIDGFVWPEWLAYGAPGDGHRGIKIVPSGFFSQDYGLERSVPRLPLRSFQGVPLLFGEPRVERHGSELVVGADLVAGAYFLLTRYEEWVSKAVRDQHGRFPGKESLPFRGGFLEQPVVDEYSGLLKEWCAELGVNETWPDRRFSVLLSHDIDTLGRELGPVSALRALGSGLCFRINLRAALAHAGYACGLARHPYNNIGEVHQMDRSLIDRLGPERCRVAYFFMVGGEGEYDRTYKIQDPLARRALAAVKENGADIGLHASYAAGQEPRLIARERALLEKTAGIPITKNRHHILGWRETSDGHEIAAGGIGWDSTMGYADVPGFRLGVCRPVPLFDPIAQKPLGIEEHPMTIMECTLSKYMNLDEEQAFACVRRLADATIRYRGEFVVNWHNSWLSEREPGYHRRLYQRMLDYLVSQEGVLSAQAEARRQCS